MTTIRHTSCCVYNEKIRALRNQKGLTQEELARKAGLSLSSIKSLENSSSQSFRIDTVRNIALALDVDIRELIKEKATMDIEVEINNDTFNDEANEAIDTILQKKVNERLEGNRRMINELLDRRNKAYRSGQFDCAVGVEKFALDKLRLDAPMSMTEICSTIMSLAQALASIHPDKDFMNESTEFIHWIGNVLYTQPLDTLTSHVDCERIWTYMINNAYCVEFDKQDEQDEKKKQHNHRIQERYLHLIESLTPSRFSSPKERVTALLQLFFFFDENWDLCKLQPDAYITLSYLFCLFEDEQIASDDYINLDRATTVIFIFLYALENANLKKPHPIIKDE